MERGQGKKKAKAAGAGARRQNVPKASAAKLGQATTRASLSLLLGCNISVVLDDGTTVNGRLLATNREGNLVLGDAERERERSDTQATVSRKRTRAEETVVAPRRNIERTFLGLTVIRGASIVSTGTKLSSAMCRHSITRMTPAIDEKNKPQDGDTAAAVAAAPNNTVVFQR
jgi:small nuclear ribonucleoprotein (snRNP)-like protein